MQKVAKFLNASNTDEIIKSLKLAISELYPMNVFEIRDGLKPNLEKSENKNKVFKIIKEIVQILKNIRKELDIKKIEPFKILKNKEQHEKLKELVEKNHVSWKLIEIRNLLLKENANDPWFAGHLWMFH